MILETERQKIVNHLDVLVRDTVFQVGNIEFGAGLYGGSPSRRSREAAHRSRINVMLPRRVGSLGSEIEVRNPKIGGDGGSTR